MPSPIGSPIDLSTTLGTGANPSPVDIVIPPGASAVIVGLRQYSGVETTELLTATLGGDPPDDSYLTAPAEDYAQTGILVWYGRSGTLELDLEFDHAPSGWGDPDAHPRVVVVDFAQHASAVRDGDTAIDAPEDTPRQVTLSTEAGDYVWKFDGRDTRIPPGLSSGWTNRIAASSIAHDTVPESAAGASCRASYIIATGPSTVCDSEDEEYSSLAAIALFGTGNRRRRMLIAGGVQ